MGIEVIGAQGYQSAPVVDTTPVISSAASVSSVPQVQGSSASSSTKSAPLKTSVKPAVAGKGEDQIKSENGEQPTEEEIKSAINQANRRAKFGHTQFGHANAEFSYHEETKRISIKIIDQDTNEVIREIPPEETLDMISKMWELAGIIVDEKR